MFFSWSLLSLSKPISLSPTRAHSSSSLKIVSATCVSVINPFFFKSRNWRSLSMSAFVKKLVEKASMKKPGGFSDGLRPDDLDPRLVFHYGIPSGSALMAYDFIQQNLAISTKDGEIKLYGKDGSQTLLESPETVPSKFLLFVENLGILLNINVINHIEVWDVDKKSLSSVHNFETEITSFAAMQHTPYLYAGDSTGAVSVLRLDKSNYQIELMKYRILLSASHGEKNEVGSDIAVKHILPQPTAVSKRVLIIYSDGVIALWSVQESKTIYKSGVSTTLQSQNQETKKVTAACWVCLAGTKVAIGYSNGDILLWSVPCPSELKPSQDELGICQTSPICKLNLGYKAEKIPIAKMKWLDADGKSSRLYVLGSSDYHPANLLQVVLLNEHTESRTIKVGLNPPESLVDFEITMSSMDHQNKNRCDCLLLLGRSSHIYAYDDSLVVKYLVQSKTKSLSSLPKEVVIKLPYGDTSITVTKFITGIPCMATSGDEDFNALVKNSLPLFPFERSLKDGNSNYFNSFSRSKNVFITGHSNGAINFWDASCPLLLPVTTITQQSDNNFSVSGIPLTALQFNYELHFVVSGDQSGTVRIYTFKSEAFAPQSPFLSFQGSSKKGSNLIHKVKVVKVNGAVISINTPENLKQLAIGSDQGYVSLIDPEGPTILYQIHIASELCTGIVSTHFETCSFHGFEKNVVLVATKDSSVLALERDTGNKLSTATVRPKKPYQALFSQVLDGASDNADVSKTNTQNATKQPLLLLCSEKAVYVYSLTHLVEGVKKVVYKKKFHTSCFWVSTFGSPAVGLILLFTGGKIEIRSLPELSLVRESSIRGFVFSSSKPSSDIKVSSSHDGELVIANGDQELLFVSTLIHNVAYRFMDSVSQVFNKDLRGAQGIISSPSSKEKKKGLFGSVIKDDKATKSKVPLEVETENARRSIEELSTIFSVVNFPIDTEIEGKSIVNDEDGDIDIDDIDIEDPKEKPRGYPVIAGLNRQNITSKFQAIKGKLKHAKTKNERVIVNDVPQEETSGAVDQIKKKYGYASSGESSLGVADIARNKLSENLKKLQGISLKTNEMQDTARSFSCMAKEVLRFAENDKKGS